MFLNLLLLYNWQQLYVSLYTSHMKQYTGRVVGLRPRTQQCSVGPGAMACWTCYVQKIVPVVRRSWLTPGSGSPNVDCIALACRMLFRLPMPIQVPPPPPLRQYFVRTRATHAEWLTRTYGPEGGSRGLYMPA